MKTCLICSHKSDVDMSTCPHCGEASWGEPEQDVPSDDTADTEPSTPKAKRAKK